ncbi:MAG: hypothetical protein AAF443_02500 [Chlamydiota bacterium]
MFQAFPEAGEKCGLGSSHLTHLWSPNMKTISIIFTFVTAFLSLWGKEKAHQMVYIYNKEVGGYQSQSRWVLTEKGDELRIEGKSSKGQTTIISSPDRQTKSFTFQSTNQQNDYMIYRDGPYLIASGIAEGQPIEKSYNIRSKPWFQEFDFSLKPFILSQAQEIKFYIIHPKKMSMHHMVAKKREEEELILNGKNYSTIKVKMSLTGFKGMFWSAQIWFDRTAGDLLKYVANEGPNTPTGIITLLSKKTAASS